MSNENTSEETGSKMSNPKKSGKENAPKKEEERFQKIIKDLEDKLKKKDEKIKELEEDIKWKQSDLENYRKSVEKRMDKERLSMKGKILKDFLPFFDAFDKAIPAIEEIKNDDSLPDKYKKIIGGIEGLYKNLEGILTSKGMKRMEVVGKPFDYNYHEVVFQLENPDVEEDTVVQEVQKGWLLDGKVLKPACVAVSKHPPKNEIDVNETASDVGTPSKETAGGSEGEDGKKKGKGKGEEEDVHE
ncbi:MAG: nucleotide exchange factor GrpE [Promethearchaeota archaeon]